MPKSSKEKRKGTIEKNNKRPVLFLTAKKPKAVDPLDSREGFYYKEDIDEDDDKYLENSESLEEIFKRRKKLPTKRDAEEVNKRKQTKDVPKPVSTAVLKRKRAVDDLKEHMKRKCRKHDRSRPRGFDEDF